MFFPERQASGPQTHALVIGVGGYRHLVGGSDPKTQVIPQIGVLRQLTTAPRSAVDFATLLIEKQDAWQAPLGSVELLLSTAPDDSDFTPPAGFSPGAGFDDIQLAYDAWRDRCDSDPGNVAIFYYCGHGVEKEEQYLLTEDFGKFPNNPWRGAFAIDSTVLAMRARKAQTQVYVIDSCREITDPMKDHDIRVSPLETPDTDDPECEHLMLMKATAAKETALGPKKGVAYATQALRRALEGAAASDDGNGWVVRSGTVADKITDILRMVKTDQGFTGRCPCLVTNSAELLRLDGQPQVMLELSCTPPQATDVAHLTCQKSFFAGEPEPPVHEQTGQPLRVSVEAGIYVASATFPNHEFSDARKQLSVSPPVFEPCLKVAP